jgi:serine/threonine protein kinase
MTGDARLGQLMIQSGLLTKEALERLRDEQTRTQPPTTLFDLVVRNGIASEEKLRELVSRADQYPDTQVLETRLGKFELRSEIGRGGMGIVYLAWQTDLQRAVALKVIPANTDPGLRERFLREARVASRLKHPNIVAVHEYGEAAGSAFFAMDYVQGASFDEAMKTRSFEENARLLAKIARALHHAHGQGLVHRDLKPQNIMVSRDGTPFLTDFGLARELNVESPLTVTGQILGTPAFMSPEQARGGKTELGPASDLYSLGAVLYVALTGRPPFRADSVYGLLDAIIRTPPVRPSSINPRVPAALEELCLRCLEKDPARRPASAEELALALEQAVSAGTPPRTRSRAIGLAVAGAVVAIAVGAYLFSSHPPPAPLRAPESSFDPAWFASTPKREGSSWTWTHPLSDPLKAADWKLLPRRDRASLPPDARIESSGFRIRNAELRFKAPLEGEGRIAVELASPAAGAVHGVSLGGYRLARKAGALTLTTPGERIISRPLPPSSTAERLELEIGADWVAGRTGGKEVIREPLKEAAQPLPPGVFAQEDTTIVIARTELHGKPRVDWAENFRREREEFAKVGQAYRLLPELDLLHGGALKRHRNDGGAPEPVDGPLVVKNLGSLGLELHGPDTRNARLRLRYVHSGSSLVLRFRAGFREILMPLPCGGPEPHDVEILALEQEFRCIAEGAIELECAEANGTDFERITTRLKAKGGDFSLLRAQFEEISGVPPGPAWIVLFSGQARGLEVPATWTVQNGFLTGSGDLRSSEPFQDVELEVILNGQKGTRLSFGARGSEGLLEGEAVPMVDGSFSGFSFRVRGAVAELENDRLYLRRDAPSTAGPLTIRVSGAPVQILTLRARPLR